MLEDRVTNLEIKYTSQEEFLIELNSIVAKQQQTIDKLEKQLKALANEKSAGDDGSQKSLFEMLKEEKPPHY